MTALHFTTIPCEPYTAHEVQGKPYFLIICPCANDIIYGRFKDVRTLLHYLCGCRAQRIMGKCISHHLFPAEYSDTLMVMFKFLFFLFVLSSINLSESCVYPLT